MAWTAPMTASAGAFTAAQFNANIRDNFAVTFPGAGSLGADHWVATGTNTFIQRQLGYVEVLTSETTASTSYTDLATTASVSRITGTRALVVFACQMGSSVPAATYASVAVSSATTVAAADDWAMMLSGLTAGRNINMIRAHLFTGLTPGSNVFTMKYKVASGTGTFLRRRISVMPF